ncbi:hypothetical protein ELY21_14030 [Legionella sp. km535]|uniref:hypothetical protein n=1 Tax=Legionella sp. km535 TaxID=2498107 RepID=UPI000F8C8C64|nr:hypothetical protein [Legionella sp. km535]RUR15825.1 hypothetical protein ELY21_14030 [Legionella sp. km535]
MECIIQLNHHHRSRERIRDLGEVFTPEGYVSEMLRVLETTPGFSWDSEQVVFFEPCCGHGNIVIEIFLKRLEALFYKSIIHNSKDHAAFYAVANAINLLWAIDIDPENIIDCRGRLLRESVNFLMRKLNISNYNHLFKKDKNYMAHLLCAIKWHIQKNEMLSAITSVKKLSKSNAYKTKVSRDWLIENKHQPINFELTWIAHFKKQAQKNSTPALFKQALKFVEEADSNISLENNIFDFARFLLVQNFNQFKKMDSETIWSQI